MTVVSHSGNECSGKCGWTEGPCGHVGCWQCAAKAAKAKATKAKAKKETSILRGGEFKLDATEATSMSRSSAPSATGSYAEHQTTTITRAALEGLVSRIPGLYMQWNNGEPILSDKDGHYRLPGRAVVDPVGKPAPSAADFRAAVKVLGSPDPLEEGATIK